MIRTAQNRQDDGIVPYERRLDADLRWAMDEGSVFFEGRGAVQAALRRLTAKLDELGVDYAVAGGMALFMHGFRRYTEDVDVLVTGDGLTRIHEALEGLGYVVPFAGSKNLRDVHDGVRIKFLLSGGFPGDGKPKPVAFPDPKLVAIEREGVRILNLPTLIELKLASGMTSPGRLKDLADVQQLAQLLKLDASFGEQLHPYVRPKFAELVEALPQEPDSGQ